MKLPPKRACVGFQRLSKRYFLSLLPSYPDTQYVIEVVTGQKVRIDSIDSTNQPLNLKNGLYRHKYEPIETAYPRKLFFNIKDSDWKINSFNPNTREICFSIKNNRFSFIVPDYFWK